MTGSDPLVRVYAGELDETYLGLEVLLVDRAGNALRGVLQDLQQVPSQRSIDIAIHTAELLGVPDAAAHVRAQAAPLRHTHLLLDGLPYVVDVDLSVLTTVPRSALEPTPPVFP